MNQPLITVEGKRSIWVRGLSMLLMALAYQLTSTLLAFLAIVQFVIVLAAGSPNARLRAFGAALGLYLGQIARFESFASDDLPFPFADWPSEKRG